MKKISMKEIAALSGISVATVSRVINNNGRFSEETKQRVLKVIEETGYNTNSIAKGLRMNKTQTIGIVVPDITNHFFADVVQKIEEVFFEHSYSTIICNTGRSTEKEKLYLKMLESKMVDGLIFIAGLQEFDIHKVVSNNIPIIYIDRKPHNLDQTLYIASDHYQGATEATTLLLKNGAKNPVLLKYTRMSSSANERLNGFIDVLKKYDIQFNEENHMVEVNADNENNSHSLVYEALAKNHPNSSNIDAVFAVNDLLALDAVDYFLSINKKVPDDVQVIGFDDSPITKQTRPKISSVRQDTERIAHLACDNLLKLINNEPSELEKEIHVPVKLSLKETTHVSSEDDRN